MSRSVSPSPQPATLGLLLRHRALHLTLVTPAERLAGDALDRTLRGVHSSDLADPTPFLTDGVALLTTGAQFVRRGPAHQSAYVRRLSEGGVAGLGFGREVTFPEIPEPLQVACAEAGLPLFEVPYRTPFIAVTQAHADASAAHAFSRRTWALETQRALALAALRPQGLDAMLAELARRLDAWVGMIDATGHLVSSHPHDAVTSDAAAALTARAADIITRGQQAGQSLAVDGQSFTLFSLGRDRNLRGVIAIGAGTLDPESRAVVTSVIATAGLALDQGEELRRQRRRLRAQVLASLRTDDPDLARRVLGSVPPAPFLIAVADFAAPIEALAHWWERAAEPHDVFAAESDAGWTVCLTAGRADLIDAAAARFGIRFGVSSPARYDAFSRAHAEAQAALRRGTAPVTRFADTEGASLLTALATEEARLAAAARLEPLRANGDDLERCLRVWLGHDTKLEAAASELGIHRHTLRTRIAQASRLLGTDLSTFPARAELWAALHATSP